MIFLTGDVHHMSLKSNDQKFLSLTEAQLAEKYLQIALDYGIKVTLFISGKTFVEEPRDIGKLLKYPNLEIGGHTWNCFKPFRLHQLYGLITSSFCGPYFYQERDIKKAVSIIERFTGRKCCSWRGHANKYDKNTIKILNKYGVKILSSELNPEGKIVKKDGLIVVPINILPDHSYIYHGHEGLKSQNIGNKLLKRIFFKNKKLPFGVKIYNVSEWYNLVIEQIELKLQDSGYVCLLIHPVCMEIVDRMETFKQLCKVISKYNTHFFKDLINNYAGKI